MSRSTQFIGLTKRAQKFVKDLKSVPSDKITLGMFEEEIPLRRWEDDKCFYQETVQAVPWSSGPMIFTHLEMIHKNCINYDENESDKDFILSWVKDPDCKCEFDEDKGIFWV